jgi:hypothetical protein
MKKMVFILSLVTGLSCTKTVISDNKLNLSAVQGEAITNASVNLTKFGSNVSGSFTTSKNLSILRSLNVKYVRGKIIMNQWTGKSWSYENFVSNGIGVVLNVNYDDNNDSPFPEDMTLYRKKFNSITDKYQPEVIVVENEEINPHYHQGAMSQYIQMLKVALDVCHSKGIKVTNGGIYGGQLEVLTYRYLQKQGQKRADSFAQRCMDTYQVKAAQTPNLNKDLEFKVRQLDTLLRFYHNLDYVNIHFYEPCNPHVNPANVTYAPPLVLADIQEYLKKRTGRPVMTNETCQRNNTSATLVTSMLRNYSQLNFPYVVWRSGDGVAGDEPLYNLNTGSLYSNGVAFSNFNGNY